MNDSTLKLTHLQDGPRLLIRIEGRLDADGRDDLLALLAAHDAEAGITLDLSGLRSADAGGRALLAELRDAGCTLTGASLYLNRLLGEIKT